MVNSVAFLGTLGQTVELKKGKIFGTFFCSSMYTTLVLLTSLKLFFTHLAYNIKGC